MRIVRCGTWVYDGSVQRPVDVVSLNFDAWHEIANADGQLVPGEQPRAMGPDGWLYFARFRKAGERSLPTWVDGPGYETLDAALRSAEVAAPSDIQWTAPRANPLWKTLATGVAGLWCLFWVAIGLLVMTAGVSDAEPSPRPGIGAALIVGGVGPLLVSVVWAVQDTRARPVVIGVLLLSAVAWIVGLLGTV